MRCKRDRRLQYDSQLEFSRGHALHIHPPKPLTFTTVYMESPRSPCFTTTLPGGTLLWVILPTALSRVLARLMSRRIDNCTRSKTGGRGAKTNKTRRRGGRKELFSVALTTWGFFLISSIQVDLSPTASIQVVKGKNSGEAKQCARSCAALQLCRKRRRDYAQLVSQVNASCSPLQSTDKDRVLCLTLHCAQQRAVNPELVRTSLRLADAVLELFIMRPRLSLPTRTACSARHAAGAAFHFEKIGVFVSLFSAFEIRDR